jgi:hypothetical protein
MKEIDIVDIKSCVKTGLIHFEVKDSIIYCRNQSGECVKVGEQEELQRVRHGRWTVLDECANDGVYCSCCHKKVYKLPYANQRLNSQYCPNCGAKME